MPGKNWPDRASALRCPQPGRFFDSHQSSSPIPGGGLLVCPVVVHSQVPWTWEAQPLLATGQRPERRLFQTEALSTVDVAASPCGACGGPWAGDDRRTECQREDGCRWATALLPSGQSDDAVRPFPSSSLPRVCVDAPARLSLRFAHASGRPVSLTQDVRHARNSGEFWKDHNLGRLAHRVEVHNEEHQRCLCERAHLVREDS